jgi:hypothetical protein
MTTDKEAIERLTLSFFYLGRVSETFRRAKDSLPA